MIFVLLANYVQFTDDNGGHKESDKKQSNDIVMTIRFRFPHRRQENGKGRGYELMPEKRTA